MAYGVNMTDSCPVVRCESYGSRMEVLPYGRGHPPERYLRRLRKACRLKGCQGEPKYRAGFGKRCITGMQDE